MRRIENRKGLNSHVKLLHLQQILQGMDSALVAFSGGVDSTFLLKVASTVLPKDKLLAVTAVSTTYPDRELRDAERIARKIRARHRIIHTKEMHQPQFKKNLPNRCYFCKKELFTQLRKIARKEDLLNVLDASNISDEKDFRPGNKARLKLKVRSPLVEADLGKDDIRNLSKKMGLETWNKPALACLASRVPYGIPIEKQILERVNKAEEFLIRIGFFQVRVRDYGVLARIEVSKDQIKKLILKCGLIVEKLKSLGYSYITVDLEGYRPGSMNLAISRRSKR